MNERLHPSKVDLREMRAKNERMLLRLIWENQGTTRALLARETGLSASTVSSTVARFEADGLVRLRPSKESSGGRPPVLLSFDSENLHVVGIEMGASHLSTVLATTTGRVISEFSVENDIRQEPKATLRAIEDSVRTCLRDAQFSGSLLGIGLAVPSPLDPHHPGKLSELILPKWAQVNAAEQLSDRFGLPAYVENDANAGALAELWFGAGTAHFAYVKVGTGIGSGHVLNGRLYRGAGGIAGELGHISVDLAGPQCLCGNRGCLNVVVGSPLVLASAAERCTGTPPRTSLELAARAVDGEEWAQEIVAEVGSTIGVGVAALLGLMNPQKVIFGGSIVHAGEHFLGALEASAKSRSLLFSNNQVDFSITSLGRNAIALGAATLPLDAAFDDHALFQQAGAGSIQ